MKERVRYMAEHGTNSYLSILLASDSFSDFLNRWERWEKEDAPRLSEYSLNHIRAEQAIKTREPFREVSQRAE